MPKYFYSCDNCEYEHVTYHGISEILKDCPECNIEALVRVPQLTHSNPTGDINKPSRPGKIVDQFIKDSKQELKTEKQKLASEVYDK